EHYDDHGNLKDRGGVRFAQHWRSALSQEHQQRAQQRFARFDTFPLTREDMKRLRMSTLKTREFINRVSLKNRIRKWLPPAMVMPNIEQEAVQPPLLDTSTVALFYCDHYPYRANVCDIVCFKAMQYSKWKQLVEK